MQLVLQAADGANEQDGGTAAAGGNIPPEPQSPTGTPLSPSTPPQPVSTAFQPKLESQDEEGAAAASPATVPPLPDQAPPLPHQAPPVPQQAPPLPQAQHDAQQQPATEGGVWADALAVRAALAAWAGQVRTGCAWQLPARCPVLVSGCAVRCLLSFPACTGPDCLACLSCHVYPPARLHTSCPPERCQPTCQWQASHHHVPSGGAHTCLPYRHSTGCCWE